MRTINLKGKTFQIERRLAAAYVKVSKKDFPSDLKEGEEVFIKGARPKFECAAIVMFSE